MKKLIIISLSLIIISCSPFISKDLRRKNRCNRKLARVTRKCPELLHTDTIQDTLSFNVPRVEIDTFVQIKRDTSILTEIKNDTIREWVRKYINTYKPFEDTITQKIDDYTFVFWFVGSKLHYRVVKPLKVIKKINKIPVKFVKKVKLTIIEQIRNILNKYWWWFIIVIILYFAYKIVSNKFL